jgi:A/G-specific adenine glycosylase
VYVSEVMLQQTQVKTVLPYFEKFMARFPHISELAFATEDEVLAHWSGLGYYTRARNLHKTAKYLHQTHQGTFPIQPHLLAQLPGIGPSTAAAIASLAYNQPFPILDGNVKRVLARYFMVNGAINQKKTETILLELAQQCMSTTRCADYTQAIMDLGAICCRPKQPSCTSCPLKQTCTAYQQHCVEAYPEPNPKKSLPTKNWQFLLFYCQMKKEKPAVYLEKRPNTGIWGGLWSVPVLETEINLKAHLENIYHLFDQVTQSLPPFRHTFTHFHLNIHATLIPLAVPHSSLNELHWFHEEDLIHLGLPKPIKTLLTDFWFTTEL